MYKVREYHRRFVVKYVVQYKTSWFTRDFVRALDGTITFFDTKKGAQAYINQMNKLKNESRRSCCLYRRFHKTR
jgi:hypothetical protein